MHSSPLKTSGKKQPQTAKAQDKNTLYAPPPPKKLSTYISTKTHNFSSVILKYVKTLNTLIDISSSTFPPKKTQKCCTIIQRTIFWLLITCIIGIKHWKNYGNEWLCSTQGYNLGKQVISYQTQHSTLHTPHSKWTISICLSRMQKIKSHTSLIHKNAAKNQTLAATECRVILTTASHAKV